MKLDCHNCGAPKTCSEYVDVFRCEHCGTVHVPSAQALDGLTILEAQSDRECSLCRCALRHARADRWPVLCCPNCVGVLTDGLTFWKIVEYRRLKKEDSFTPPGRLDARDLERRIDCPKCETAMIAHPYYGPGRFVIDFCKSCSSVWLDRGEIDKAVNARDD